ncbi:MAG: hypothetical protein EBV03_02650 [Proteobacteria bacterium]|nr:hypothetical protein [Pseudomonadota bacterium]
MQPPNYAEFERGGYEAAPYTVLNPENTRHGIERMVDMLSVLGKKNADIPQIQSFKPSRILFQQALFTTITQVRFGEDAQMQPKLEELMQSIPKEKAAEYVKAMDAYYADTQKRMEKAVKDGGAALTGEEKAAFEQAQREVADAQKQRGSKPLELLAGETVESVTAMRAADIAYGKKARAEGQALVQETANALFESGKLTRITTRPRTQAQVGMINGGIASGKSEPRRMIQQEFSPDAPSDRVYVNADLLKGPLSGPEHRHGDEPYKMSGHLHPEAKFVITDLVVPYLMTAEQIPNVLIDQNRPEPWSLELGTKGEKPLRLVVVATEAADAVERSFSRGKKEGRYEITKEILTAHRDFSKTHIYTILKTKGQNIALDIYDNNVKPGEKPRLIAQADLKAGSMDIIDPMATARFFNKSNINIEAASREGVYATPQSESLDFVSQVARETPGMKIRVQVPGKDGAAVTTLDLVDGKLVAADPAKLQAAMESSPELYRMMNDPRSQALLEPRTLDAVKTAKAPPDTGPGTPSSEGPAPVDRAKEEAAQREMLERVAKELKMPVEWVEKNKDSALVKRVVAEINPVDPVTGYGNNFKRQADVGAAMKDAKENGKPYTYVDVDVDNMKGMAQKVGDSQAIANTKEMLEIVKRTLAEKGLKAEVYRHSGHAQGDEFSLVVQGDEKQVKEALKEAAKRVQDYAREKGLADIAHTKPGKQGGVGLSFGTEPITGNQPAAAIFAAAEERTEAAKQARAQPAADVLQTQKAAPVAVEAPPPAITPEKFDLSVPLSVIPDAFVAKGEGGAPLSLAQYADAIKSGKLTLKDGIYVTPEGQAYAPIRHPFDASLDRVLLVPAEEVTPQLRQRVSEMNTSLAGGKPTPYRATAEALHTANRPLNWALLLTGGKGVWDQAQTGQLLTAQGIESSAMLVGGVSGEIGSFVGLNPKGLEWGELSRAQKGGALLRGAAVATAPLLIKDAGQDMLHALGYYTSDADKKQTQERQKREDASGTGFLFGVGDAKTHDAFRATTKAVAGAEGTYIAGRFVVQGARSLLVKQAEKELAKQVVKAAAVKATGSALGMLVPGVNIIMATDMACDLAVGAAERHLEEGTQRLNLGVAVRNNLKTRLPTDSAELYQTWADMGTARVQERRKEYESMLGTPGVGKAEMDTYVTMLAQKKMLEERMAQATKSSADATPELRSQLDAQIQILKTDLKQLESGIGAMGKQMRAQYQEAAIAAIDSKTDLTSAEKKEQLAFVAQNSDYYFSDKRMESLVALKRTVQRGEAMIESDNIAYGTRARSIEIIRQYPNIFIPLEKTGMLKELDDATLASQSTYGPEKKPFISTMALSNKIRAKQEQLVEEINALSDDLAKGPKGGFTSPGLGYQASSSAMGYEAPNRAYNDLANFVIHGYHDDSYSGTLAKLQEYQDALTKDGNPKDGTRELAALQKTRAIMDKIRTVYQLEETKKALSASGLVEVPEIKDGKATGKMRKIPSFKVMMELDMKAKDARDTEMRSKEAALDGQMDVIAKATEPYDAAKEIATHLDSGEKAILPKLYLGGSYAKTPLEREVSQVAASGMLSAESRKAAEGKLAAGIAAAKDAMKKDPALMAMQAEVDALSKEVASLKTTVPALIKKTELALAADQQSELKAELEALNKTPVQPGTESYMDSQKAAVRLKLERMNDQIAKGVITDPAIRAQAMDYVMNPKSAEQLKELEGQLKTAVKTMEEAGKNDPALEATRAQLVKIQKLTQGDLAAEAAKVQAMLGKKAALDTKVNVLRAKVYEGVQQRVIAVQEETMREFAMSARKEVQKYQKENEAMLARISGPDAPKLADDQKNAAATVLNAYQKSKDDFLKAKQQAAMTEDPAQKTQRYLQATQAQMDMLKAQRAYFEFVEKSQVKDAPAPDKKSPEGRMRASAAQDSANFNIWASQAARVATTPKSQAAMAELIVLRQQMVEARTEAAMIGSTSPNPLAASLPGPELRARVAKAMDKLSLAERKALARVNAEYDATLGKPADKTEEAMRRTDRMLRGDAEALRLQQRVEKMLWYKNSDTSYRPVARGVRGVPDDTWSPGNEALAREMLSQLEEDGRSQEAEALLKSAKEKWNVDLNVPIDDEMIQARLREEALLLVPTQTPDQSPDAALYRRENDYGVFEMAFDPNASRDTYRALSEEDALRVFMDTAQRTDVERAMGALPLFAEGRLTGPDGSLSEEGKAFMEKIALRAGEESMALPAAMSDDAQKLLQSWSDAKLVNLPAYSAKNAELVLEVLQDQMKKGNERNVDSILSTISKNPDWGGKKLLDEESLMRAGKNGLAMRLLEREVKALEGRKRDADTPENEFNAEKASDAKQLRETLDRMTQRMKKLKDGLVKKGLPVTQLSDESQKLLAGLKQRTSDLMLDSAKATVEGKSLEDSKVAYYQKLFESTERYKEKDATDPKLTDKQREAVEKENRELKQEKAALMGEARNRDAESVRSAGAQAASELMLVMRDQLGPPVAVSDARKETLRTLAAMLYEQRKDDFRTSKDAQATLEEFSKAVERATGYTLPVQDIMKAYEDKKKAGEKKDMPAEPERTGSLAPSAPEATAMAGVRLAEQPGVTTKAKPKDAALEAAVARFQAGGVDANGMVPGKQRGTGKDITV